MLTNLGVLGFVSWEKATDYELCYWYAIEIERRMLYYSTKVKCTEVFMDDLTIFYKFCNLMSILGIQVPESYSAKYNEIVSTNQNPVVRTTKEGPAAHLPDPSVSSVAVGN